MSFLLRAISLLSGVLVLALPIAAEADTVPPYTTAEYASYRLAQLAQVPASATTIKLDGYYAAGDGGAANYARMTAAPTAVDGTMLKTAEGSWWRMSDKTISIRAFGAKGNGADDTAAVTNFFYGVSDLGVQGLVDTGRYSIKPILLTGINGLHVSGTGNLNAMFQPVAQGQQYLLQFDGTSQNYTLDGIGFLGAVGYNQPVGYGLIVGGTRFNIQNVAVYSSNTCFWMQGSYGYVNNLNLVGCTNNFFLSGNTAFVTAGNCRQQASSDIVQNVYINGPYTGPAPTASNYKTASADTVGTAVAIDLCSAYLKFDHITGAGTRYGIVIEDDASNNAYNAYGTQPNGIFFRDINFDWGGDKQFAVLAAGLVDVDGAWVRSIGSAAAYVQNFNNLHLRNFNAYTSNVAGLEVTGQFNELTLDDPGIVGNGWPNNTGGINVLIASGSGRVTIHDGQIANGNAATHDYPVNAVSNLADYNLAVYPAFTGPLKVMGTSLRYGRIADTYGVIGRQNTTIIDTDLPNLAGSSP